MTSFATTRRLLRLSITLIIVTIVLAWVAPGSRAAPDTPPPIPTEEVRARFIKDHGVARGAAVQMAPSTIHDEYDVTHYDVSLELDIVNRIITGAVQMQATAQVPNLSEIEMDLDDTMMVDAVTAGGFPTPYTHSNDLLSVTLDGTYQPDDAFTVACNYHGSPTFGPWRWGLHSGVPMVLTYSEPYGAPNWWACKDDPKDKATFAIHLTAPDTLFAVSNGSLDSIDDNGDGTKTFHWLHDYKMSPYLFSIAVTNFESWTEVYTALDGVTTMDVDYYAYPEDLADAQADWSGNIDMMEYFASIFGEYPFLDEKYAIAEFAHPGAMEHQTATSMGAGWITGTNSNDFVVVHELAHSWVGDMITMTEWSHAWCKEGFATFCEALYFESQFGHGYYHTYMNGLPIWSYAHWQLFEINPPLHGAIYYKGAWVLHMLRNVLGESPFFDAILAYTTDYPEFRYDVADTDDLRGVFEDVSGVDLTWFFDQWIYSPGYPDYEYGWTSQPAGGGYDVQLQIDQVQSGAWPIFKMPIDVLVMTSAGEERFVVWDSLGTQSFALHTVGEPMVLELDPDNWILAATTTVGVASAPSPAVEVRLAQNRPNPFNPATTIGFSIGQQGYTTLRIYDASGRLVARPFEQIAKAGEYEVVWNGRSDDGTPAPAGIYFHRLESAGTTLTGRMALVK